MQLNQCNAKFCCIESDCRKSEAADMRVDCKCCKGGGEGAPTVPEMEKRKHQRPQCMVKDGWMHWLDGKMEK